jgi:serine/threonine-protein kinase RsbW
MQFGDSGLLRSARSLPVALAEEFSADEVSAVRHAARGFIHDAGVAGEATDDFLVAVHELVINAVIHGGGYGVLTLRLGRGMLLAEISDRGPGFATGVPQISSPPAPGRAGGRGLVLARTFSDAMLLIQTQRGITAIVMLHVLADRRGEE